MAPQFSLSLEANLKETILEVESGFMDTPWRARAISIVVRL